MTEQRTQRDFSETEQQKARSSRSSSTTTTGTTTTYHTEPGVSRIDPWDLEAIREAYTDLLGPLNSFKAQIIEAAMQNGMTAGAILDAIRQTAFAPRPSHAYLTAIIRRYITYGIHTAEEAEADRQEYAMRREAANRERAAWYKDPRDNMPW